MSSILHSALPEPSPAPSIDPPAAASAAAAAAAAAASAAAPAAPPAFGEVLIAGCVSHSFTGRQAAPAAAFDGVPEQHLWSFNVFAPLSGKRIVQVISGCTASHYLALDADGAAWVWGRNERGQLGLGDTRNRYQPVKLEGLPKLRSAALGRSHTLLLTSAGDVWAAGDNKAGQLGIGKASDVFGGMFNKFVRAAGLPGGSACSVSAGSDFSAVVAGGGLFCAGSQEYGQCGSGKTGEYIVSAGRTAFKELVTFTAVAGAHVAGVVFTAVASGEHHTVALARGGVPYSWGYGAYGRLGHGNPADVLVPTPIKFFELERNVSFEGGGLLLRAPVFRLVTNIPISHTLRAHRRCSAPQVHFCWEQRDLWHLHPWRHAVPLWRD